MGTRHWAGESAGESLGWKGSESQSGLHWWESQFARRGVEGSHFRGYNRNEYIGWLDRVLKNTNFFTRSLIVEIMNWWNLQWCYQYLEDLLNARDKGKTEKINGNHKYCEMSQHNEWYRSKVKSCFKNIWEDVFCSYNFKGGRWRKKTTFIMIECDIILHPWILAF